MGDDGQVRILRVDKISNNNTISFMLIVLQEVRSLQGECGHYFKAVPKRDCDKFDKNL